MFVLPGHPQTRGHGLLQSGAQAGHRVRVWSGPRVGEVELAGGFRHLLLLVKDGQHLVLELGVLASLQLVLHDPVVAVGHQAGRAVRAESHTVKNELWNVFYILAVSSLKDGY